MVGTRNSKVPMFSVSRHLENGFCCVLMVQFNVVRLEVSTPSQGAVFNAGNSKNVRYRPSVIKRLDYEHWRFHERSQIHGEHAVFD